MNKNFNTNKTFFWALIIYFTVLSFLHFIRLTFAWEIIIKSSSEEYLMPTYISGFLIIFFIIIILKSIKILSKNKETKQKENIEKEQSKF